ncbi:DUF1697 domain-containing protein [Paenibacillus sp. 1P07SE]|uniref:DUF1697 domain-containing protein n=1 Tax=Paenibacillus sp. 1P07SE TaxID=3132209 RepID=UPI0039A72378
MVYVALLRGIIVGGNNKIDMKTLKRVFEEAGMEQVVTYINSGNIVFIDRQHGREELPPLLEEAIQAGFGLNIRVLIRSLDEFHALLRELPEDWTNDQEMKSDVLFLWDEINDAATLEQLVWKPEIEDVRYVAGAILYSVSKEHVTRGSLGKLIGTKIYSQMTIRNVNTTRKIYELMKTAASIEE